MKLRTEEIANGTIKRAGSYRSKNTTLHRNKPNKYDRPYHEISRQEQIEVTKENCEIVSIEMRVPMNVEKMSICRAIRNWWNKKHFYQLIQPPSANDFTAISLSLSLSERRYASKRFQHLTCWCIILQKRRREKMKCNYNVRRIIKCISLAVATNRALIPLWPSSDRASSSSGLWRALAAAHEVIGTNEMQSTS